MIYASCQECHFRPGLCHGSEIFLGIDGCATFDHSKCEENKWTCICNHKRLIYRLQEVGGFDCKLNTQLRSVDIALPHYIPTFYHSIPGANPIDTEWIALPLSRLFVRESGRGIAPIAPNDMELRQNLGVNDQTKIIVTGPGPDQGIEDFWRYHQTAKLFEILKKLRIELFTVPNFSFFSNAAPMHHRYNRSRILRVAERASEAGINAILHLNAIHEDAWKDFEMLLIQHTEIVAVCMEFQTGYASSNIGMAAINRLIELQLNIGRPLHPILIGAAKHAKKIGINFTSSTIIDANPFMHTVQRKVCTVLPDGRFKWPFRRTRPDESLIPRFKYNLQTYSDQVARQLKGVLPPVQTELGLRLSPGGPIFPTAKQKSVGNLGLFCQDQKQPVCNPASQFGLNSARSTDAPDVLRSEVEKALSLSRAKSAAIRPSSHRKNIPHKRQPNGFGARKKTDVEVDH